MLKYKILTQNIEKGWLFLFLRKKVLKLRVYQMKMFEQSSGIMDQIK